MQNFAKAFSIVWLAGSLTGCATGSFSLDPNTAHFAAGLVVAGEPIVCGMIGKSDLCSKKTAKTAAKIIDSVPPPAQ